MPGGDPIQRRREGVPERPYLSTLRHWRAIALRPGLGAGERTRSQPSSGSSSVKWGGWPAWRRLNSKKKLLCERRDTVSVWPAAIHLPAFPAHRRKDGKHVVCHPDVCLRVKCESQRDICPKRITQATRRRDKEMDARAVDCSSIIHDDGVIVDITAAKDPN
jgi:hypothetical protein